jgi:hypothetical protein
MSIPLPVIQREICAIFMDDDDARMREFFLPGSFKVN